MNTLTKQKIPLLDLNAQYENIKEEVKSKLLEIFDSKWFINGPEVDALEENIARYCNVKYAVGVSSGSDALIVALMTLNIGQNDEVITTPFSFFATAGSISRVGAKPIFCDINPDTFNIDPDQIESKITSRTKAIMPVHLFGQCADMDKITKIANKHNLSIIEDAAQAIGSSYISENGLKKAGSFGDIGCFSFFPSKNLGACGDGGVITTNNEELFHKIKSLRNHGEVKRYHHQYVGGNFRLDAIQAAVLNIKINHLDKQHEGRKKNANFYNKNLSEATNKPIIFEKCNTIYNQYTLKVKNRDNFQQYLNDFTIGNNIYYPIPLHLQECFKSLKYKEGDFPNAEKAAKEVISLPIYSELTTEQLEYVSQVVNNYFN
ncbi:MAG: transcriptional regulator [Rickettsiales bacterium]|nr:transcriptional regulator [Rickettsiales bacterium]|tara:strand:- start:14153 stop:15280 length:1128 start_codon:yes stop_codon:yes gene_type:complete